MKFFRISINDVINGFIELKKMETLQLIVHFSVSLIFVLYFFFNLNFCATLSTHKIAAKYSAYGIHCHYRNLNDEIHLKLSRKTVN